MEKSKDKKVVISAEVLPTTKQDFKIWWKDRFVTEAEAVRYLVRIAINDNVEARE